MDHMTIARNSRHVRTGDHRRRRAAGHRVDGALLLEPGDPVWMEEPGYFGSWKAVER
jgi:hypothetical protein